MAAGNAIFQLVLCAVAIALFAESPARRSYRAGLLGGRSLVEIVNDAAIGGINEVHAMVSVIIAIPAHRRTPIRRHRSQLDIGGHAATYGHPLSDYRARHLLAHNIFFDVGALFGRKINPGAYRSNLDTHALGKRRIGRADCEDGDASK